MILEEVLVGDAALDKPDALLFYELPDQNMEIGHFLVRCRKTMIDHKMDLRRIPDLLNAHFTEDLDRQRSRAILGHCHVGRYNSNLSRMVGFLRPVGFQADDFLSESKRIIVQDCLRQPGSRGGTKTVVIKDELLALQITTKL